jgi:hypothetical protein
MRLVVWHAAVLGVIRLTLAAESIYTLLPVSACSRSARWRRSSGRKWARPAETTTNGSAPPTSVHVAGSERTRVCPGSRKKTRCSPHVWPNPTNSYSRPLSGWNEWTTRNRSESLLPPVVDGVRERHRGASDRDVAPRVSPPSHRPRRAASSDRADRVRAVLQPGAATSDARIADASAEGASHHRHRPIASSVERATPSDERAA